MVARSDADGSGIRDVVCGGGVGDAAGKSPFAGGSMAVELACPSARVSRRRVKRTRTRTHALGTRPSVRPARDLLLSTRRFRTATRLPARPPVRPHTTCPLRIHPAAAPRPASQTRHPLPRSTTLPLGATHSLSPNPNRNRMPPRMHPRPRPLPRPLPHTLPRPRPHPRHLQTPLPVHPRRDETRPHGPPGSLPRDAAAPCRPCVIW